MKSIEPALSYSRDDTVFFADDILYMDLTKTVFGYEKFALARSNSKNKFDLKNRQNDTCEDVVQSIIYNIKV